MDASSVAAKSRVEDAQRHYKHVRREIFPRVRSVVSAVSAFAAVVVPSPTLKASFAAVSVLSAAAAVWDYYQKDVFGFSDALWLKIAKTNLHQATQESRPL
ncbi:MAG TPA: hypothetical protein PLE43_06430 [Alphaproteobacteria bacterium]|nr:hypothetical protein [Alphaproteobacteria bacterium]MCB9985208.1 hypothetical protein [Micavibrio sp.]HRK98095.1 hypothetical protein [Alphaproteobacteria bacterium]